ncbi:MAG TPA: sugar kinase [Planctomycetes bacterium]|nr:sugar kinase [Planctomycetota bacterium]
MSLLVVGSIAFDSVATPFGERRDILGGAASYFSVGASLFTPVRLAGVVGEDFPEEHIQLFRERGIDLEGLQRVPGGLTFRWAGRYEGRMDVAETLETHLNVLGECTPSLPERFRETEYVLLANDHPKNQLAVARAMTAPKLLMMDTMNLWIDHNRDELLEVLTAVDALVCNDEEARSLGENTNLIGAMKTIRECGPRIVLVKKGEHGSIVLMDDRFFALPAWPLEKVVDPTGAGDTFASGVMGWLARQDRVDFPTLKTAMAYGTVVASYNVEAFGLDKLRTLRWGDIERRYQEFIRFLDLGLE